MKKANSILTIILLVAVAGCGGDKQSTNGIITVDVTASYPEKELILQDFMDVEYIPLEMNDDFLTQGFVQAIGKDIILVRNTNRDGNIFIFNRNGKGLKKINHLGQSGKEYTSIKEIALDEDNGEMFVNSSRIILVYDLEGNFKRSFKHKEGANYNKIYNFDRENLICYDGYFSNDGVKNEHSFMIISKQDGSITKEIHIPFTKKKIVQIFA
ncbi:hypothetical protein AGMMS50239_35850 [Bacteroidia bacterium]|nr:hypothetical protein AGMMS50239_35850 [Bacteroidia bacterium]